MSKITLTSARDIALDRLVASDANVRRIKAGVSIEQLAADIARRGLLQSLSVRPLLGDASEETGKFAVSAGGRRLAALKLLVKQKRLAKNAPVPCIVKTDGIEEEDSLAENTMREALHPVDQFRAFKTLNDQGLTIEEIAARFFVAPQVVRQRLKLAAASPKLLGLYVADQLSLEQLMAFCVTDDHARQEEVWEALARSYSKEPYVIRRMLTEGAVRASDKRAIFVGIEAYEAGGGVVLRDLFAADQGGWLQDVALLDRLAREKLSAAADEIRAEGWKWAEVSVDFPYGHTNGMRHLPANYAPLSDEEQARYEATLAEYNSLSEEYEGAEDLPEEVDQKLAELEQQIAAVDERPAIYDPSDIARAGIFVSIDHAGALKVERGFVHPEDEAPAASDERDADAEPADVSDSSAGGTRSEGSGSPTGGAPSASSSVGEDETETSPKLSDRLLTELTAHRTLALRNVLANDPQAAFLAAAFLLQARVTSTSRLRNGAHPIFISSSVSSKTKPPFADISQKSPITSANCWSSIVERPKRTPQKCADQILRVWEPDAYEIVNSVVLGPGESHTKDARRFRLDHARDWLMRSAIKSRQRPGFVECVATLGGDRRRAERRFLVPEGEYDPGHHGFVIDPARHESYEGPSSFVGWAR